MSTPRILDLPPHARLDDWPVRGGSRRVLVHRPASAERWVILVPGLTGSKEDFIAMIEPLAAAGCATVAYDQLGQFESAGSPREADYSLRALAADLCDIEAWGRSALGFAEPAQMVGHSFGGLVVQVAAALPAFEASSVTLLCSGPAALPEHRRGLLPALIDALPTVSLADLWLAKRAWERSVGEPEPAPGIEAFCRDRWLRNHPVGLRAMARILCSTDRVGDALAQRSEGGLPVLVLWGEHDDAWPVDVQRAMAADLGAVAVELLGCAHSPNVENPVGLVAHLA